MKDKIEHLMRAWERQHPGERMSIRRLANLADVSPQTIQRLKRGEHINDASKIAIARILECEVSELIAEVTS